MLFFEKDFRPVQKYMLEYVKEHPYSFLAVRMGMGKTAVCLTLCKYLLQTRSCKKILVVAPKRVAKFTWPDEIHEWDHLRELKYSVIIGEQEEASRIQNALSPNKIHIVNRENLPWLWNFFQSGKDWPYDVLIYDEGSRLKAWKKKTKSGHRSEFGVLAVARKKNFKRVVILSGTPTPNGLIDLGGPIYLLDLGERLGVNKTQYMRRYFDTCAYSFKVSPKSWAFDEITKRISDICISLRTEDYVTLPDQIDIVKKVRLSEKDRSRYTELEKQMFLEEYDLLIANRAVLVQKLLQLCNGSFYVTNEKTQETTTHLLHKEKIEALKEIIESAEGKPVLIAYSFQFDRDLILKEIQGCEEFDDRDGIVERWNKGQIPVLLAHPASIGHGLNLQKGSNVAVWYGLTWSLELYQQFNSRLVRPGQPEEKVFLYHILTEDSYEMKVYETLRLKDIVQDDIIETLKVKRSIVEEDHD